MLALPHTILLPVREYRFQQKSLSRIITLADNTIIFKGVSIKRQDKK
jgi:hypothetical protein